MLHQVHYISRCLLRIHPNLYTRRPETIIWESVFVYFGNMNRSQRSTIMDISSVLISIQSLLDMNPLDHEPGFTGKTSEVHENYSMCLL